MHRTPARPMAFTARGISITGSSWAWAHGLAGVTGTDGAAIASSMAVVVAIAAAVVMRQVVHTHAAAVGRQSAAAVVHMR